MARTCRKSSPVVTLVDHTGSAQILLVHTICSSLYTLCWKGMALEAHVDGRSRPALNVPTSSAALLAEAQCMHTRRTSQLQTCIMTVRISQRYCGACDNRSHVSTDRLAAGAVVSIFVLLSMVCLGAAVLQLVPQEVSHLPSRRL